MNYFLCLLVWFLKCLAEYKNGINNGTKWFIKAKDRKYSLKETVFQVWRISWCFDQQQTKGSTIWI